MSLLTLLIVFLHSSRLCEPVGTLSIALRLASGSEDNTVRLWDRASLLRPWIQCRVSQSIEIWEQGKYFRSYEAVPEPPAFARKEAMSFLEQYLSRANEIIGERTAEEEKYDKEVLRWLSKGKPIGKAIARANKKYPSDGDRGER